MDGLSHYRETEPLRSWGNRVNRAVIMKRIDAFRPKVSTVLLKRSSHDESKDMLVPIGRIHSPPDASRHDHGFPLPIIAWTDSHARPAVATRSVTIPWPSIA